MLGDVITLPPDKCLIYFPVLIMHFTWSFVLISLLYILNSFKDYSIIFGPEIHSWTRAYIAGT